METFYDFMTYTRLKWLHRNPRKFDDDLKRITEIIKKKKKNPEYHVRKFLALANLTFYFSSV